MKQYLEIGKIVNVHGLRGDVKVVPWCDDPEFLCEFDTLYLGKAQKPVTVTAARRCGMTAKCRRCCSPGIIKILPSGGMHRVSKKQNPSVLTFMQAIWTINNCFLC